MIRSKLFNYFSTCFSFFASILKRRRKIILPPRSKFTKRFLKMSVLKALNLGNFYIKLNISLSLTNYVLTEPKAQRKFIDYYNSKFSDENTLVFRVFERSNGDYYSIHGRDTNTALKTSFKSSFVIKNMDPDELPSLKYACLNRNIFEKLLKELLLVIGYKVEVYTSLKGTGKEEWNLEFKGSPGNLSQFEEMLFSNEPDILSNLLLSLQLVTTQQQKVINSFPFMTFEFNG